MSNLRYSLSDVALEPGPQGERVLTVDLFDRGKVDVVLSEDEAVRLVRMFQEGFVARIGKRSAHPHYPHVHVLDANLAHGQSETGLLLETAEIGSLVLSFSSSVGEQIKAEIDRKSEAEASKARKI